MRKVEFGIVGMGIAGACLALELVKRGKSFVVFNKPDPKSASMVAAGLFNPITGRKMVKTWMANEFFDVLFPFYQSAEKLLDGHFFHPIGIYRPLLSFEEVNDWNGKSALDGYQRFIKSISSHKTDNAAVLDNHGGVTLAQAGYLDVKKFLLFLKNYLVKQNCYIETDVLLDNLNIDNDCIEIEHVQCEKLILATGVNLSSNKQLRNLPFTPVKGETLTLRSLVELTTILNRKVFCIPVGNNEFRIGATYDWRNLNFEVTKEAETELLERLSSIMDFTFEKIGHHVGIRPATKTRRPLLGVLPETSGKVFFFGGLGSKGVSMAPYMACHLLDHIEQNKNLLSDVNIEKYYR